MLLEKPLHADLHCLGRFQRERAEAIKAIYQNSINNHLNVLSYDNGKDAATAVPAWSYAPPVPILYALDPDDGYGEGSPGCQATFGNISDKIRATFGKASSFVDASLRITHDL